MLARDSCDRRLQPYHCKRSIQDIGPTLCLVRALRHRPQGNVEAADVVNAWGCQIAIFAVRLDLSNGWWVPAANAPVLLRQPVSMAYNVTVDMSSSDSNEQVRQLLNCQVVPTVSSGFSFSLPHSIRVFRRHMCELISVQSAEAAHATPCLQSLAGLRQSRRTVCWTPSKQTM